MVSSSHQIASLIPQTRYASLNASDCKLGFFSHRFFLKVLVALSKCRLEAKSEDGWHGQHPPRESSSRCTSHAEVAQCLQEVEPRAGGDLKQTHGTATKLYRTELCALGARKFYSNYGCTRPLPTGRSCIHDGMVATQAA